MNMPSQQIRVVAPNLKRRLSGVTATIARLVPLMASRGVVATGPGLPGDVPHISLWRAAFLPRDRWRIWHARRNTEMLLGLLLRHVLRRRYLMVFTSASQRVHTGYTKWLIGQMDHVIATSQKTAGYLDDASTVVLHGIDTTLFSPAPDRIALRRDLGLPTGKLVGCFGRIRHQKGTDVFVDAMIQVCADDPDAIGIVMGRATEKHQGFDQSLKAKVAQAGLTQRILFKPEVTVDAIPAWYQALDLFVAPQRWEGFGLTPIEAMACGVPVVATTVGAFEELVTEGENGHLIAPGDVFAMATAIDKAMSDPAKLALMSSAARSNMLARFRLEREADEIMAIYDTLLDGA